jgi:hypothetical protein
MSVCDSCLDVIYDNLASGTYKIIEQWWHSDEDYGDPALQKDMESFCISMGGDIEDHDCDETATDGEILCQCGCHPRRRKQPV